MLMWSRNHFNVLMREKFVKKGNGSKLYDFFYFGENKFSPENKKKKKIKFKKTSGFDLFHNKIFERIFYYINSVKNISYPNQKFLQNNYGENFI